jgi:hypothetical protein
MESIVCLKVGGLFVGFVVQSTVPSLHHWQKRYFSRHRPYTVMTRSLGTSVISCTARAVFSCDFVCMYSSFLKGRESEPVIVKLNR